MLVRRRHARAFVACSALAADRAGQGLRLFRETLEAARTRAPVAAEVARAKALRLAQLEGAWDDADRIAQTWREAIALGTPRPSLERRRAEIERVTVDDLARLAQEVLRPETIRWVVSGERLVAASATAANGLGPPAALVVGR